MMKYSKYFRYLFAGLLNTIFGNALYILFIFFGVHYIFSLVVSTALGIAFNFLCFGYFVFDGTGVRHAFIRHVLAYLFIMTTNAILLWFLIESIGIDPYRAQLLCIPVGVVIGWLVNNNWVYKRSPLYEKTD